VAKTESKEKKKKSLQLAKGSAKTLGYGLILVFLLIWVFALGVLTGRGDVNRWLQRLGLYKTELAARLGVAPPAELLEQWLARIILPSQPAGHAQSGCRLVIWLDELEQRFVSASFSKVVLAARAQLMQGERVLAQQSLQIVQPAATPDSAGGVQATREAARALTEALAGWLSERRRSDPSLAQTCSRG